jgi:hypothetical protein
MKRFLLIPLMTIVLFFNGKANTPPDEGMWLPMLVERLNHVDMQKMGLQLTAEELYSINNSSIKDAIVSMGFFCTGELVSDKGLYLTNHHCGYGAIQAHSSVDHDYLTDGFWAKSFKEELPVEDLTVYVLNYMDDVTKEILKDVTDEMTESERNGKVRAAIREMAKEKSEDGLYRVDIKPFLSGNEYYMFVYHQYRDVRLVGAPPSSIGKYGGDTDNWMWPRHTGDFSMFRIYTNEKGEGVPYAETNVPFKPKHHLPISIKGVQENDFSMIWGYPGTTDRYLTSYGIQQALDTKNPTIVEIRDEKLAVLKKHMNESDAVRIKYSAKYAQTANYWKYLQGQSRGLKRLHVKEKKKAIEDRYEAWANENADRKAKYGSAVQDIAKAYAATDKIIVPMQYYNEAVFQGPEYLMYSLSLLRAEGMFKKYDEAKKDDKAKYEAGINKTLAAFAGGMHDHFKDYDFATDKDLFISLMGMYFENVPKEHSAYYLQKVKKDTSGNVIKADTVYLMDILAKKYKGDIAKWADVIYDKSMFVDSNRLREFINEPSYKQLKKDPGFIFAKAMYSGVIDIYGKARMMTAGSDKAERLFVDGCRQMDAGKKNYYPNANSTLRMTYGQVKDYQPQDAVTYDFRTTMEGLMAKEDPNNDEFIVPAKLKQLYEAKDYGRYADKDGKMYVCFLTTHDITGGNSGSPVMNAKGELIGIAFDGNWEAMSGDIFFENAVQRTINVDIRYVLFVIEKLGGATNLIEEMTIVE